ncbi:unnamed protein product [Cyprideis torosa]|uniref:Uncharacterized protein n=1 Tax=Cyprideis torosa TaxID=163714 RepID=A0A7R8ZMX3_9CRUS|nr:unnamed protein product [Cyprideis torosa]CAG0890083.1 unnamed protein product [Cyprideis torosa]
MGILPRLVHVLSNTIRDQLAPRFLFKFDSSENVTVQSRAGAFLELGRVAEDPCCLSQLDRSHPSPHPMNEHDLTRGHVADPSRVDIRHRRSAIHGEKTMSLFMTMVQTLRGGGFIDLLQCPPKPVPLTVSQTGPDGASRPILKGVFHWEIVSPDDAIVAICRALRTPERDWNQTAIFQIKLVEASLRSNGEADPKSITVSCFTLIHVPSPTIVNNTVCRGADKAVEALRSRVMTAVSSPTISTTTSPSSFGNSFRRRATGRGGPNGHLPRNRRISATSSSLNGASNAIPYDGPKTDEQLLKKTSGWNLLPFGWLKRLRQRGNSACLVVSSRKSEESVAPVPPPRRKRSDGNSSRQHTSESSQPKHYVEENSEGPRSPLFYPYSGRFCPISSPLSSVVLANTWNQRKLDHSRRMALTEIEIAAKEREIEFLREQLEEARHRESQLSTSLIEERRKANHVSAEAALQEIARGIRIHERKLELNRTIQELSRRLEEEMEDTPQKIKAQKIAKREGLRRMVIMGNTQGRFRDVPLPVEDSSDELSGPVAGPSSEHPMPTPLLRCKVTTSTSPMSHERKEEAADSSSKETYTIGSSQEWINERGARRRLILLMTKKMLSMKNVETEAVSAGVGEILSKSERPLLHLPSAHSISVFLSGKDHLGQHRKK